MCSATTCGDRIAQYASDVPYIPVAVVNDEEGMSDAGTSPPITANLLAWHDASDLDSFTFNGVGRVTAWADKSGNGFHATAQAPMLLSALPGEPVNRPALWCDSVEPDQYLTSSCTWPADPTSSAFIVVCISNLVQYRALLSGTTNGNQWVGDNTVLTTFKEGVGAVAVQGNASLTEQPMVLGQLMTATTCRQYIGLTNEEDAHAAAMSAGTLNIARSGSLRLHGFVSEVVLYNTNLSTGDAATTITHLMNKWDVA